MKKEDAYYIRGFLVVVVITATLAFVFARPRVTQSSQWQASSYNASQPGHKGLYVTLAELGWPVEHWQENYQELESKPGTMLISRNTLGRKYAFNETERRQLLTWVRNGNRLLLFGDFISSPDTRALLEEIGFKNLKAPTVGERLYEQSTQFLSKEMEMVTLRPTKQNSELPERTLDRNPGPFEKKLIVGKAAGLPPLPPQARALWRSELGPEIAEIPYGRGTVVWTATPEFLDNEHLKLGDNLNWLIGLLAPNGKMPPVIYFEEAHHGFRAAITLEQLWSQPGLQLALIEMALGLLVYLIGQQIRFGPLLTVNREVNRRSLEFVRSMGRLYQRASLRNEIVEYLFKEAHKRILLKFNLPANTSHDVIAKHLQEAFPHLPQWKKLAKRFDSPEFSQGLPPGGWLRTAQELILIRKEMI